MRKNQNYVKFKIGKCDIEVADAEVYTTMMMRGECKKGIEREIYQNNFNKFKTNYDQALIELKKKQT